MTGFSRRSFIQTTIAATAAFQAHAARSTPASLIDTNVSLGQWPFRREELNSTAALVAKLRNNGVTEAWAGSFDALLHKDISSVNARLADECNRYGDSLLIPIGAINPMLPAWEDDLRRCVEVHGMPGVRLHPNYHRFKLSDPIVERLMQLANEHAILVQIAVIMEEERTIHPLVNVPATDTTQLSAVVEKFPNARVQLLNAFRTMRGAPVLSLAARGVHFEIAMLESVAGIAKLFDQFPPNRLCFGSHAPFFYFESAKLKLQESALSEAQMKTVCFDNARSLLPPP
jgi:predicted TIM-barrel fold metal-dependent hydrolase